MDTVTIGLLLSISAAFCWWLKIGLDENRARVSEQEKEEEAQLQRIERVRRLTNRQ